MPQKQLGDFKVITATGPYPDLSKRLELFPKNGKKHNHNHGGKNMEKKMRQVRRQLRF